MAMGRLGLPRHPLLPVRQANAPALARKGKGALVPPPATFFATPALSRRRGGASVPPPQRDSFVPQLCPGRGGVPTAPSLPPKPRGQGWGRSVLPPPLLARGSTGWPRRGAQWRSMPPAVGAIGVVDQPSPTTRAATEWGAGRAASCHIGNGGHRDRDPDPLPFPDPPRDGGP